MKRMKAVLGVVIACMLASGSGLGAARVGARSTAAEAERIEEARARAAIEARLGTLDTIRNDVNATRAQVGALQTRQQDERKTEGLDEIVTVSGIGRVAGTPDVVIATLGVSVERPTIRQALEAANRSADKLIRALKARGVKAADIQTAWLSVWPVYDYRDGSSKLRGYHVSNTVHAKVRNVREAGSIIGSAVEAAGSSATLQGISFDLEGNTALTRTARRAAVDDALEKARDYARHADRKLGRLISLTEGYAPLPPPETGGARPGQPRVMSLPVSSSIPLEAGQNGLMVVLTVVFALR